MDRTVTDTRLLKVLLSGNADFYDNVLCLRLLFLLRESLSDVLVVLKSLGMGFHLPVDGIRSLSLVRFCQITRESLWWC